MWAMMATIMANATIECQMLAYCISSWGVSAVGKSVPITLLITLKVPANMGISNGNSSDRPDRDTETPSSITVQKMIFWPALNFFEEGWDLVKMPPPALIHCQSSLLGMLCATHMQKVIIRPSIKAQAMLLCSHLEPTARVE